MTPYMEMKLLAESSEAQRLEVQVKLNAALYREKCLIDEVERLTKYAEAEVKGADCVAEDLLRLIRKNRMTEVMLLHLRNHTSVSENQIALIDAILYKD